MKYKRLSVQKHYNLLRSFYTDITATACAQIVGISRNTVNTWHNEFRHKIMLTTLAETRKESWSSRWTSRTSTRGGCEGNVGAAGKTLVFGLLKRGRKVIVRIVPDCSRDSLMPTIQGLTLEGSTVHSDEWKAYDDLVLNSYDHYHVFHHENEFAHGKSHVRGIENFWNFAKRHLAELDVVIRQGNCAKPQIADVHDLESGSSDSLTRGGFLEITGSNLTIKGTDESVGLYFMNVDDESKSVKLEEVKMGTNSSTRLACVVPATLADGTYQIKVVTQFAKSKTARKEPLSFVFDKRLTAGNITA